MARSDYDWIDEVMLEDYSEDYDELCEEIGEVTYRIESVKKAMFEASKNDRSWNAELSDYNYLRLRLGELNSRRKGVRKSVINDIANYFEEKAEEEADE
ncbi:hypothetical protein [Companilactobacillus nodensis]|uniref:Uncharacterized protein n=1 Tax=Companilactobacillus nodensis DSM 19682 = JCM 14932 = NBRC 107160 TaxID=1423775 RepID=A0A0R1KK70_9LACO|nr:hypothetical protein [Companilactobacillus nodensis]KRK79479.1 hypothetical protein FD03_GL000609 [Companilactobacillus nodensis DSM 19682 = JCM 14932 = NBRC 107160]